MKTFFLSLAGAFVAILLFIIISFILVASLVGMATATDPQPDELILSLDLREDYVDQAPTAGLAAFSGLVGFTDLLVKIDRAAEDPDVQGLFLRASEYGIGSSRAEELRGALAEFREAGKFVVVHSQGMLIGSGASSLWSISAADEIWLQPGTDVAVAGIVFETPFVKELLDDLSITAEFVQMHEFKNAPNMFEETSYTEPHRLALEALGESVWTTGVSAIAADRGLQVETLRTRLESGPMSAKEAMAFGLADQLGWPEDARSAAQSRAETAEFIDLAAYDPPTVRAGAPMIAIVGGEGPIVTGGGEDDFFAETVGFGSDRVAQALLDAGENERVEAIVFRVDTGGGSAVASDQIWNAVTQVREAGTPVIVSMGGAAASGGYYISAGADHIVANASTITGSIGVFGGKFAISEGLAEIGINLETVRIGGEWAEAFTTDRFTETQFEMFRNVIERTYDRFLGIVAEGRGLTAEEVHERARGRIWSGEDALEQGLVDSIGGFTHAIDKAKELSGIEVGDEVRLIHYPARRTGIEALEEAFGVSAEAARGAAALSALAGDERFATMMREWQASRDGGVQARASVPMER